MALDFDALLGELQAEGDHLLSVLESLSTEDWSEPTPAEGWTIREQVSHLAYFDDCARIAMVDVETFQRKAADLRAHGPAFPDVVADWYRTESPASLLRWFATSRGALLTTFRTADPKHRLPWFGPDMSVASSATARLMETFAHGRDVYDTVGVHPEPSPGLRSIAHLGVSTFGFAHAINGRAVPDVPVRVELTPPDNGETWTWGPADAADRVSGRAEDFVLAVTQRRHPADLELTLTGPVARGWMAIAQAYAGEPGPGRTPKESARE